MRRRERSCVSLTYLGHSSAFFCWCQVLEPRTKTIFVFACRLLSSLHQVSCLSAPLSSATPSRGCAWITSCSVSGSFLSIPSTRLSKQDEACPRHRSFHGACACGAVSYTIDCSLTKASICHCKTCQAWSGGVFIYVETKNAKISNEEYLTGSFCKTCGSSIYCKITASGPMECVLHFGAGTLQDWKSVKLDQEIFFDRKPAGYVRVMCSLLLHSASICFLHACCILCVVGISMEIARR